MGPSWTPLNAINTTSVTLKCNIVIRDSVENNKRPPTPCRGPAWRPCWWSSHILPQRCWRLPLFDACEAKKAAQTFSFSLFSSLKTLYVFIFLKAAMSHPSICMDTTGPKVFTKPLVNTTKPLLRTPCNYATAFHGFSDFWG